MWFKYEDEMRRAVRKVEAVGAAFICKEQGLEMSENALEGMGFILEETAAELLEILNGSLGENITGED